MIITAATPLELVDWFHAHQEEQCVLCIMLAPAEHDQRKVSELVLSPSEMDAVLGKNVAFLLIHPGANVPLSLDRGYGSYAMLRGTTFPTSTSGRGLAYALRETELFRDMSNEAGRYRNDVADTSARAMAHFVPEFMELFGVSYPDLPAMCVLVRGLNESAVLPLGSAWTRASLLELLGRIRSIAEPMPNFRHEYFSLADTVFRASELQREIDAKLKHVVEILESILLRHQGSERDKNLIAEFVAGGCPSTTELQTALARLSFYQSARYVKDGQVTKVSSLMRKAEAVRGKLKQAVEIGKYTTSIEERAKQLVEGRERMIREFLELRDARIAVTSSSASASKPLKYLRSAVEVGNLTWDVGAKLLTAVEWLRKFVATV